MPVALSNYAPVPADTAEGSFNVSAETVGRCITPDTRALTVAHIGGEPIDLNPLADLAHATGLPLVEDCSQAHGAAYRGRLVGTTGQVSIFSTMASKHHCTGGQGGVIFTRDEAFAERIDRHIDRGKAFAADGSSDNLHAALNLNGSDLAACIGRVQLRRLPGRLALRRKLVTRLAEVTSGLSTMAVVPRQPESDPSYWFIRIRLELAALSKPKRDVVRALRAEGIPAGDWADLPCTQSWFGLGQALGSGSATWRVGEAMMPIESAIASAASHFVLHVNERWSDREIADVADAMAKVEASYQV